MIRHATIAGVDVIIGTPEECEAAAFVVCGPISYYPDDVHTLCSACGSPIVHRPYVPAKPPKICIPCVLRFEGGAKS